MGNSSQMEWRLCPRFSDYEVSDCGELRRAEHVGNQPGRRLRGVIDADGYIRYGVRKEDGSKSFVLAHRMVAEAFLGLAPSADAQVAHNNGSRLLNTPSNLRWATCLENQQDRSFHDTSPVGGRNPNAKITEDDVRYIRRRYREIKIERGRVAELDERFGLSRGQIIDIARGKSWAHVA